MSMMTTEHGTVALPQKLTSCIGKRLVYIVRDVPSKVPLWRIESSLSSFWMAFLLESVWSDVRDKIDFTTLAITDVAHVEDLTAENSQNNRTYHVTHKAYTQAAAEHEEQVLGPYDDDVDNGYNDKYDFDLTLDVNKPVIQMWLDMLNSGERIDTQIAGIPCFIQRG